MKTTLTTLAILAVSAASSFAGLEIPPVSVPDGGLTIAMLGLALGCLGFVRRKIK
jgi:hypothetical protein